MKVQEEDCIEIDDDNSQPLPLIDPQPINIKGCTSFDVQYAILSDDVQPSVIIARLKRNFEHDKKIQLGKQSMRPRKEPNYAKQNVLPVENQIILFGVDFSKKKLIRREYNPTDILVINVSNWKLSFPSYAEAWAAIQANVKDPQVIVSKMESDEVIIPRCWFEMKPSIVKDVPIALWARFATTEELNIQQNKEEQLAIYQLSRDIFNEKQRQKQDEMNEMEFIGREKLERRKERMSQNLHRQYQRQAGSNWHPGMNQNPGAHREERERSRDNFKRGKPAEVRPQQDEDAKSNYSFLMSRSKQDAAELNAALDDLNIDNKSLHPQQHQAEVSLSYNLDLEVNESPNPINPSQQPYIWSGASEEQPLPSGYRWSYRDYMAQKEREQQLLRQKQKILVQVISLDDD